ncbi:hypothetical protein QO010_000702 [Caulobacter ginsengisoli]|uniref:Uncharacterized protein n=1 Tax=Caulobacter ginsengisoli TaxID=400775 RepID=A0ABU0ILS3_9CAUL|nr:hypothetical protein [Caulobacter ginsengisoli]MDQ0462954.1 hypothetical protein [Caulobacter ginsengisoli]
MTRPHWFEFLIGNALVILPLGLGMFWFGWLGISRGDNGYCALAIICLVAGFFANRAYERVRHYLDWEREWNALAPKRKH